MREPGDRRPLDDGQREPRRGVDRPPKRAGRQRRSMPGALALAVGLALLSALGWAVLRGVLELSVGLLALAAVAGWGMGASLRGTYAPAPVALVLAAGAWLLGLVLTWMVAMALLQGSTRTFLERLESTPFVTWIAPQFGLLEVAGLVLYLLGAAYGVRRPSTVVQERDATG